MSFVWALPGLLLPFAAAGIVRLVAALQPAWGWRAAFVLGLALTNLLLVASTELLSQIDAIRFPYVLTLWLIVAAVGWALPVVLRRTVPRLPQVKLPHRMDRVLVGLTLFSVGWLLLQCLLCPPNTWDSMTYHMARVAHWWQHGHVGHYPTHIVRQLSSGPGAEYIILHLTVLGHGSDLFASSVQWMAALGSAVTASLVVRELGHGIRIQATAALLVLVTPTVVLQASSTQNDLVTGFWVLLTLWCLLRWYYTNAGGWLMVALGVAGLGLLTKATFGLFAAPFLLLAAGWGFWQRPKQTLMWGAVGCLLLLAFNTGVFLRNWRTFGNPLGESFYLVNEEKGIQPLVSNTVRLASVHLQSSWAHKVTEAAVTGLHKAFGWDVSDPRYTFGEAYHATGLSRDEDYAGNLHITLLALLLPIVLHVLPERKKHPPTGQRLWYVYMTCVVVALLLFCGYLKWQIWHGRLTVPLFLLLAPWLAVLINRLRTSAMYWVLGILAVLAAIYVLLNPLKPMGKLFRGERTALVFQKRQELEAAYLQMAGKIEARHPAVLGIHIGGDDWEYPLWRMLLPSPPRFVHIGVTNPSAHAHPDGVQPDMCIQLGTQPYVLADCAANPNGQ